VDVPVARGRHELRNLEADDRPDPREYVEEIDGKGDVREDRRELLDDLPSIECELSADHEVAASAAGRGRFFGEVVGVDEIAPGHRPAVAEHVVRNRPRHGDEQGAHGNDRQSRAAAAALLARAVHLLEPVLLAVRAQRVLGALDARVVARLGTALASPLARAPVDFGHALVRPPVVERDFEPLESDALRLADHALRALDAAVVLVPPAGRRRDAVVRDGALVARVAVAFDLVLAVGAAEIGTG